MNQAVNIWAMNKDMPLKLLLLEWQQRYGQDSFQLNLHEPNFQAIEMIASSDSKLSAYIYTFAQQPNHYGIDLKYPFVNIIGENENQTLEQVIAILHTHLF
jgi:hypothetical protein